MYLPRSSNWESHCGKNYKKLQKADLVSLNRRFGGDDFVFYFLIIHDSLKLKEIKDTKWVLEVDQFQRSIGLQRSNDFIWRIDRFQMMKGRLISEIDLWWRDRSMIWIESMYQSTRNRVPIKLWIEINVTEDRLFQTQDRVL